MSEVQSVERALLILERSTVAVPIGGGNGEAVGAIEVGGQMNGFSAERAASVVASVVAIGEAVTGLLGVEVARNRSWLDGVG